MIYKILWDKAALEDMRIIQSNVALAINNKIDSYVAQEPRKNGKPLKRNLKGLWVAKHARYRIIYKILESEKAVVIMEIGLRKDVYDQ